MSAALIFAAYAAAPIHLDVVGRIRLGDTKEAVQIAWHDLGPITEKTGDSGVEMKSASNSVTLCNGKVVHAAHEIGDKFNSFATFVGEVTKIYGPAKSPEIWAINVARPATDLHGAHKLEISVIRITWDINPNYMITYYEINEETRVIETLNGVNPCKRPK